MEKPIAEMTEQELRATGVPWPETEEEMVTFIRSLVKRDHDYGTAVYAMSMAAMAAYNYVAKELGTTGFQASCADMDILRRSRHMEGPFMIIDIAKALYPQYDLMGNLRESLQEARPWLAETAAKRLAEKGGAHPDVIRHWEWLASWKPVKKAEVPQ